MVNDPSALDAVIWYQDADSDGYGSVFINQRQCDQPSGYVEDNTDCNDQSPTHPNNPESCDFVDNDCDGVVDEFDAVDAVNYYSMQMGMATATGRFDGGLSSTSQSIM